MTFAMEAKQIEELAGSEKYKDKARWISIHYVMFLWVSINGGTPIAGSFVVGKSQSKIGDDM